MFDLKTKHIACSAVAAAAAWTAPVAWAQSAAAGEVRHVLPSMQVVRDPVTGRLRAPTHEEAAASAAQAQPAPAVGAARAAAKTSSMPANHPMARAAQAPQPQARLGAVGRRFDLEKMPYSVARRGADGTLDTVCVVGTDNADAAIAGKGGHNHAH
jgi:hypothetical protein